MHIPIPQETRGDWAKSDAIFRSAGWGEDQITKWRTFCEKHELNRLNAPERQETSADIAGIVAIERKECDGNSSTVFTHSDGFRCLRISDATEKSSVLENLDLPKF